MTSWHVAEMALSVVRHFEQRLRRLGATDIQVPVPGYVLWKGEAEWAGPLRAIAGVRLLAAVGDEEVQGMNVRGEGSDRVGIGATVSVPCGAMRVVGRIDALDDGKATIVAALFGRPIKVTVPQSHLRLVEVPEVWR